MCTSMVDIQSATAEIRQGKKEETGPKYNVRICYAGRPQQPQHLGRVSCDHGTSNQRSTTFNQRQTPFSTSQLWTTQLHDQCPNIGQP